MRTPHFQVVVDEQTRRSVVEAIRTFATAGRIGDEVGRKGMKDDEIIPRLLLSVKRTTFVTRDQLIYHRERPHPGYCILIFPRTDFQQHQIPALLRQVFRLPEFTTIQNRLGKVGWETSFGVRFKAVGQSGENFCPWLDH